jgi:hypothetical protein
MEAMMKKTLMVAASLMLGSAGLAQTEVATTDAGLNSAAGGYPACSRTITDRCIQLHERGVNSSANLALNTNMGSTGMGGPEEPMATHSAMHSTEGAMNSTAGIGGPAEERTGYPPCDPGPGDDSCIQLYERGVTGSGN